MNWTAPILARNISNQARCVDDIVSTPYSEVKKITQGTSVYYLKKTPQPLFIEANILHFLHKIDPTFAIPRLVDTDKENICFLMRSCGEQTLRTLFTAQLDIELLEQPIREYQRIQKACMAHIPHLLEKGVQDWRLSRLPDIYEHLVSDERALAVWGVEDGTRHQLRDLKSVFTDVCHQIATYNIPDTLNHSDLQDNNMVIDPATGVVSIIDWGEVSISHALWPVVGLFKKICWRYGITPDHTAYQPLRKLCVAGWTREGQNIDRIFEDVSLIDWIYYAISLAELEKKTGHTCDAWSTRIRMSLSSFVEAVARI